MGDIHLQCDGHIALLEVRRGPNNFFDEALIDELANALEACDCDPEVRCVVLCSEGRHFCAGANFSSAQGGSPGGIKAAALYGHAVRMFRCKRPVVAAVQGSAIGGGLGLALVADFRVTSPSSHFSANFNRIGIHPGFGLSVTLPRLVGEQQAALLFYTGRRIDGEAAVRMGLADVLAPEAELRTSALALAREVADSAPLAVEATRRTLRRGLADQVAEAVGRELAEQSMHFATADFLEGVEAAGDRRLARFVGR